MISGCALVVPSNHRTEEYTPVFAAATRGDLAAVRAAVEKDPSLLRATEWERATLLHDAVDHKRQEVAKYLLDRGVDANATTTQGLTPLHMAAQNGDVPMIALLLAAGRTTRINPVDARGWTPLDRAVKWKHPEAATFLIAHGAHAGKDAD